MVYTPFSCLVRKPVACRPANTKREMWFEFEGWCKLINELKNLETPLYLAAVIDDKDIFKSLIEHKSVDKTVVNRVYITFIIAKSRH